MVGCLDMPRQASPQQCGSMDHRSKLFQAFRCFQSSLIPKRCLKHFEATPRSRCWNHFGSCLSGEMVHRYARIHAVNGWKQIFAIAVHRRLEMLWMSMKYRDHQRSRHWRRRVFRFEDLAKRKTCTKELIFPLPNAGVTTCYDYWKCVVSHVPLRTCLLLLGRAVGWLVSVRTCPHCPCLIAGLRVSFQFFLVILVVFVPVPVVVVVYVAAVLLPPVWRRTRWPV